MFTLIRTDTTSKWNPVSDCSAVLCNLLGRRTTWTFCRCGLFLWFLCGPSFSWDRNSLTKGQEKIPSGNLTELLVMAIYSGFSHLKLWCSIVMLVYQRVFNRYQQILNIFEYPMMLLRHGLLRHGEDEVCKTDTNRYRCSVTVLSNKKQQQKGLFWCSQSFADR